MSRMNNDELQQHVNRMIDIVDELGKLNDLPLNHESRCKIRNAVKMATDYGFTRQDETNPDKKGKIILFWGTGPLSEVVEISAHNNKVWAQTDRLWGTIEGLHEEISERKAHESKWK